MSDAEKPTALPPGCADFMAEHRAALAADHRRAAREKDGDDKPTEEKPPRAAKAD